MIDPRVSWLKGTPPKPDTIVGWATMNFTTGSPDKDYEIYPVKASTGKKWQKGNLWYSFDTSDILKPGRESNL
jgi:hypothetical protein